jgi:hypothetical protein
VAAEKLPVIAETAENSKPEVSPEIEEIVYRASVFCPKTPREFFNSHN